MKTTTFANDIFFSELLAQLSQGRQVRIVAKGRSMLPLVRDLQDTLTLAPLSDNSCRRGRVVLAHLPEGVYVVHRIERLQDGVVTLRGDGNIHVREICKVEDVLAEVVAVDGSRGAIHLGSWRWYLYRYLWPRWSWLRLLLLAVYKRLPSQSIV